MSNGYGSSFDAKSDRQEVNKKIALKNKLDERAKIYEEELDLLREQTIESLKIEESLKRHEEELLDINLGDVEKKIATASASDKIDMTFRIMEKITSMFQRQRLNQIIKEKEGEQDGI